MSDPETPPAAMIGVSVYDLATGQVRETLAIRPERIDWLRGMVADEGCAVHEATVPFGHVIDLASGAARPADTFAPVIEGNAITGLPAGTVAIIAGAGRVPESGGRIAINAAWPDDVKVTLQHPTHSDLDMVVPVTAIAPEAEGFDLPQSHAHLRGANYPSIGDQLDAMWKAMAARPELMAGTPAETMLAQVAAVKAKFPKQEGKP